MMGGMRLTKEEQDLLLWLASESFSQYGECRGATFDRLHSRGLVQIHGPGEHQEGFIAKAPGREKDLSYRAVSLTESGRELVRSVKAQSA